MRDMDELFAALGRSSFRRGFHLGVKERAYLREKGLPAALEHGRRFLVQPVADS